MGEVPPDALEKMLPFEAPAGSFIAMEGRLWHTSGCNVTRDEQRRMMFAYYSSDFVRTEINWSVALPVEVPAAMDARTKALFGLGIMGNTRLARENSMSAPTA
jgi:ectoine hydroxylase-related dioxygenase (phytanoyl-CoA dioxygenase family)